MRVESPGPPSNDAGPKPLADSVRHDSYEADQHLLHLGHVRGSFTGGTQDRVGLFEAANNGTLLPDEIGEVPPPCR